jgi:hypothetical protein
MEKKNNRLFILRISSFKYPYVYVIEFISKLFAVKFHSPGAQGGTGGW